MYTNFDVMYLGTTTKAKKQELGIRNLIFKKMKALKAIQMHKTCLVAINIIISIHLEKSL